MSRDCASFRAALEAELLGRPAPQKLAWLSWNAHLLSCGGCRDLLAREEALEELLATLPEPRLPAAVARRVIRRLRDEWRREVRLESLLDLEGEVEAPEHLARDVLAGLASARRPAGRTDALDALLDLDRDVPVPPGLARRVLAGLERERALPAASAAPGIRRRAWIYAIAAGVLLAFLGWTILARSQAGERSEPEPLVRESPDPDPNLLAALPVLEEWDLLMQEDPDILLSTLEPADQALLDYQ